MHEASSSSDELEIQKKNPAGRLGSGHRTGQGGTWLAVRQWSPLPVSRPGSPPPAGPPPAGRAERHARLRLRYRSTGFRSLDSRAKPFARLHIILFKVKPLKVKPPRVSTLDRRPGRAPALCRCAHCAQGEEAHTYGTVYYSARAATVLWRAVVVS